MSAKWRPGRRLVEDVERPPGGDLRQLRRELDALRLAAGERRRRLAELDVVEADVVQRLQPPPDLRDLGEERERLLDRHLEHVGDRLALEAHLERLAVVALALAGLAGDVDVGQEVHLDLDLAVALAGLAAAALDVEREAAGLVAAHLRVGRQRVELADLVEQLRVGGRVRARRAADRRLVDVDHLVEALDPVDRRVLARLDAEAVQPVRERLVDDLVHERRLARAGDAGDRDEAGRPGTRRRSPSGCAARRRGRRRRRGRPRAAPARRSAASPERNWPVTESSLPLDLGRRPLGDDVAAVLARARPHVDEPVGGAHHLLVVLDDEHGVAEVAQPLAACRSAGRCRAGAARSTARRGCRGRRRAASRSASRAAAAAPRRPRASPTRGRARGSRRRRRRGRSAARGSP